MLCIVVSCRVSAGAGAKQMARPAGDVVWRVGRYSTRQWFDSVHLGMFTWNPGDIVCVPLTWGTQEMGRVASRAARIERAPLLSDDWLTKQFLVSIFRVVGEIAVQ